eukprot:CAMPEP_0197032254 /NCGR_PEP_ID=MMETSP1384-20130603/10974_1 /TAXON_ID=29189 /ORGANISM="Ammonia sp." /LENGTH=952 /DNA_ID=CAMNT_0042461887 /DNA_START=28 /DNA_END=2886 /DNA_ORIENTATION=-
MTDRAVPDKPKKKEKSSADKAQERQLRREKATQELVDTEVTYNTLLGLLIVHYVQPLADYKLITNEQHSTLFPQLQIIKGLSDKFLEDLKTRRESWDANTSKLSDLFETFTPYFRMYQGYVNNHEKSVALMRKLSEKEKWAEYCTNVRPLCQRFDLASLLILPIQRLPRYKLLLSEIMKNTPDAHPDAADLRKSLEKVEHISMEINTRMKEFERRETVKKIERKFDGNIKILEPHRQFIREGKLWKVCRNKDRLYHFFLFNDILLYGSSYGSKYKFHNLLPMNAAFSVTPLEDSSAYGTEKNGRIFSIVSEKKSFVVYTDTTQEAKEWLDDIQKCMEEQSKKAHSGHFKTDSHSAGIWVPDSHAKNCNICNDKFSFVNRRHHCRRCGALVCSKCSKYKLPNSESVMQRACKKCYFQMNVSDDTQQQQQPQADNNGANANANNSDNSQSRKTTDDMKTNGGGLNISLDDDDDDDDDFDDENAALHSIPYYVDNADESYSTEDIFNKFGHGVGSYVLVPADQEKAKSDYYTVTLVVYTQTGFESFNVSLFEKKGSIVFRLESKKLKKKDFNDMNGLIAYIEKKEKLIFSYAIPRNEVEAALTKGRGRSKWGDSTLTTPSAFSNAASPNVGGAASVGAASVSPSGGAIGGLENYPKAKALFDYEAEVHGDLTLRAGDIIYILDREEEDGWWTGCIGNRQGLFPSTYVEIIEEKPLPSIHKNEPNEGDVLVARYDYEEGGAEELAFNIGDKIILQAKDESGWWLGKLEKTGVVGWFAPDLVVPLEDNNANNGNNKKPAAGGKSSKFNFEDQANNSNNKASSTNSSKKKAPPNTKKSAAPPKKKSAGGAAAKPAGAAPPKKKTAAPPKKAKSTTKSKKDQDDSKAPANMGDEPDIVISYAKLKVKDFDGHDAEIDKTKLENYLSNKDFFQIFKMSRAEWASKPAWKQRNVKKEKGLF